MSFFLDHIIIPGESDGDRSYETIEDVPKPGEGVYGFYEGESYLLRVVTVAMYDRQYLVPDSKSVGAVLLAPVTQSEHPAPVLGKLSRHD